MNSLIESQLSLLISNTAVLAQSGTAKTATGWAIVLLCIGLGLLVVCRPSVRNPKQKKSAVAAKKKK